MKKFYQRTTLKEIKETFRPGSVVTTYWEYGGKKSRWIGMIGEIKGKGNRGVVCLHAVNSDNELTTNETMGWFQPCNKFYTRFATGFEKGLLYKKIRESHIRIEV